MARPRQWRQRRRRTPPSRPDLPPEASPLCESVGEASDNALTISSLTYFGRPACRLSNRRLSLTAVPALSGRVMELTVRGQNLFWINEPLLAGRAEGDPSFGGWKNWGGYKTWLAPQARWPEPEAQPDDMDNVAWEVIGQTDSTAAASLEMRGPIVPWAGVRLGRLITLQRGRRTVSVRETIHNASAQAQTWAVWAVAQFPVPGWASFPKGSKAWALAGSPPRPRGGRAYFRGTAKWKVGALGEAGWGEYQARGWPRAFRATFPAHFDRPHPDECNLAAWSNAEPGYMELEWLGPLVTLLPGEAWAFNTEWRC